jgi:putative oxidoreductase
VKEISADLRKLPSSRDTPPQVSAALMCVRVASALAFLYHGSGILFGAFGGPGPVGFAAFIHAPTIIGYLVGLAQFAGGLAMLTGVLIRIGAICIIIVMLGALMVHLPHGYDITEDGAEYVITQLLIAIAILIVGGGAYSLGSALPEPLRNL